MRTANREITQSNNNLITESMTTEQLQDGKKLAEQIEHLETQLAGWKAAERFTYQYINLYVPSQGGRQLDKIETQYVDFEVVKAITIARIEKELNELKQQFEIL